VYLHRLCTLFCMELPLFAHLITHLQCHMCRAYLVTVVTATLAALCGKSLGRAIPMAQRLFVPRAPRCRDRIITVMTPTPPKVITPFALFPSTAAALKVPVPPPQKDAS
jgi:hypothetical protein